MKLSWFGRLALALFASLALGLGMTACGGGTIAYIWVLGQQYNQIAAFKVDDYTGNLTQAPHQPFTSGGSNPVMLVVKTGGRYLYVLNQGTYDSATGNWDGAGIVEFSVGGDGSLTYEQTYQSVGSDSQWMQLDNSSSFLYILDKYSPSGDGNGSITAFSIDATTGRLFLLDNETSIPPGQKAINYWEVGGSPFMMKQEGGCLYTVNSADQTITPYSVSGNGQLSPETTGTITTPAKTITSINGSGNNIILTDAGNNQIIPYTSGGSCQLSQLAGGIIDNINGASDPTYSLITTGGTNTYLYILNQQTTSIDQTAPFSSISAFLLDPTHGLSPLNGTQIFPTGAGPVCMVEDPTNKYIYTSDHNAGTVTGKIFDPSTGQLSDLPRGSTFTAVGQAACMAISGAID
ncbi:MAG TPA: beta-propeller fold lactonase family protein [Acidobacteriaceae bacterium]|jgi:6-phosphogluconolactonase (cycloisomerase 2 family)|nr:beta-propeller fold lactonase family protein [Acidobacteriaceae bacterium]